MGNVIGLGGGEGFDGKILAEPDQIVFEQKARSAIGYPYVVGGSLILLGS